MTRRDLERTAIEGYYAENIGWLEFHRRYNEQITPLKPWGRQRYRRLTSKLMHLLTSGEESGQYAVGDPDAPQPEQEVLEA